MNDKRLMMLSIPYDVMLNILRGQVRIVDLDLPSDTQVTEVHEDWRRRSFVLFLHSASFEPVPEGGMLPELPPFLKLQRVQP